MMKVMAEEDGVEDPVVGLVHPVVPLVAVALVAEEVRGAGNDYITATYNNNHFVKQKLTRRCIICGGFRPSRLWLRGKEDQIANEMKRLANLKQGFQFLFPLDSGAEKHLFGGHVRIESLPTIWNDKIERHVKIIAESFAERNTVGKDTKTMIGFSMPHNKAIHGVITKSGELRIVTKAAEGPVANVHNRMPDMVDL